MVAGWLAGVPRRLDTVHLAKYWLKDGHPLLRRFASLCATTQIVCCETEADLISPYTRHHKIRVIHPGRDLSSMQDYLRKEDVPSHVPLAKGRFIVGTIARLDSQKGLQFLLDAFPAVLKVCPGAHLLIVGEGPLRHQLWQQAVDLQLTERVFFAGFHPQAYRYLGAMDVFVMPSLFESWGFTAIEAMFAGLPVVCSSIAGPTSFITHNQTGLLVPPQNSEAISNAVIQLWRNPDLRDTLGRQAQAHIREQNYLHKMVCAYHELYRA